MTDLKLGSAILESEFIVQRTVLSTMCGSVKAVLSTDETGSDSPLTNVCLFVSKRSLKSTDIINQRIGTRQADHQSNNAFAISDFVIRLQLIQLVFLMGLVLIDCLCH